MPNIKIDNKEFAGMLCTPCIICGSSIPLTPREQDMLGMVNYKVQFFKICNECKSAVEWAKRQLEAKRPQERMTERERWLKEQAEDEEICKHCENDDCSMCGIRNKEGEWDG